jgi:hypothetical protein
MMTVQERQAWFTLSIFGLSLIVYLILVSIFGFRESAMGAFGITGFAGFTPLIGRKERRQGKVQMDERDNEIGKAASLAGFAVVWVYFVAVCMLPFFIKGPNATITIPVIVPTQVLLVAWIIVSTLRSLVVVAMYRRGIRGQAE